MIKPFPDEKELKLMWHIAVTTSLDKVDRPSYVGFAHLLYDYVTGKYDHLKLADPPKK
jgi:hypothetical protein